MTRRTVAIRRLKGGPPIVIYHYRLRDHRKFSSANRLRFIVRSNLDRPGNDYQKRLLRCFERQARCSISKTISVSDSADCGTRTDSSADGLI